MKKLILFISLIILSINLYAKKEFTRINNSLIDKQLKLQWQDDIKAKDTKLFLEDAIKHCESLSFENKKDWRLPTYEELLSLGDYEVYKPTINQAFKNTASGHYWSLLKAVLPQGKHWQKISIKDVRRIYFSDGVSYDNDRTGKAYVRCVRELKTK